MSNQSEQIDAFLLGKLSQTERSEMEDQIKKDTAFAAAVNERRKTLKLIDVLGDSRIQQRLERITTDYHATTKKTRKLAISWRWVAVAASILLLIFAYFVIPKSETPQDLYTAYYEAYPINFGSRDEGNAAIIQAEQYYSNAQFESAIPALEQAYQSTQDTKYILAKGISEMEAGRFSTAIGTLTPLIEQQDILYQKQAIWYVALSYLKTENYDQAKSMLRQLAADERAYKNEEAQELLKKFN